MTTDSRSIASRAVAIVLGLTFGPTALSESGPAATAPAAHGDQQFFLSFTRSWRQKIREPEMHKRILTDGHAPAEYRADTVRNLDAWYDAFDVKPGQALYLAPADRVHVW